MTVTSKIKPTLQDQTDDAKLALAIESGQIEIRDPDPKQVRNALLKALGIIDSDLSIERLEDRVEIERRDLVSFSSSGAKVLLLPNEEEQTLMVIEIKRGLLGPLGNIKGLGPKGVEEILAARKTGKPLRPGLAKKLANAKTDLDSLYPITDRIKILHPDLTVIGIKSRLTPIKEVQCGVVGPVVIAAVATKIAPRDENDLAKVKKRGYELKGKTMCLNMFLRDDSDEIFGKIDRVDYERMAQPIVERGKKGKAIYAIKGRVPSGFRMIKVERILYLGDMER
jgi:hypothetical protein